ncbi:MAG TPA: sialidase family protein [Propionibacteriaceae bacterium]|jgi:predicted neuraminidase|nr:sialidase family protein [Propionibacteriaceae bacterium]
MPKHFVVRDVPGQCHASTVATVGGSFVVAWFQGDHEGAPNSRIWLTRGRADEWVPPSVVSGDLAPCWNPVLHAQSSGSLLLYFKVGPAISSWRTYLSVSPDGGLSWSDARPLTAEGAGGRGPVRTPPLRLRSGRLLAGASTETWGDPPRWDAFVDISDDDGFTWTRAADLEIDHATFPGSGIIQPTLWQTPDADIHLLARSTAGQLVRSSSTDDGMTWSPGVLSGVPNNNSAVSACTLDRTVYLAHNPTSGDWAARAPLLVSRSRDDGATWRPWMTLESSLGSVEGEGYRPADSGVRTTGANEFSYPCLIATPNGLAVSYTWQRRGIVLAHLDPATEGDR